MSTTMIQGIDVSHNQGAINVAAVRAAGFRFCVAKATEGADYEDPAFRRTLAAIAALPTAAPRFYPGAYHFGRPDNRAGRSGGEDEAGNFSRVLLAAAKECGLSLASGFLEPALDFEKYCDNTSCGTADHSDWIDGFLTVLRAETGRQGMIYTGANVWRYQVGDTDRFAALPLWQASYSNQGSEPAASPPRIPGQSSKTAWAPAIWQWSGGGEFAYYGAVPGVAGAVDINRLMGDETLLAALAQVDAPASTTTTATTPWPAAVDLATLGGGSHPYTARVQGCLLALGYGASGLVSSKTGRPDGIFGQRTEAALRSFKCEQGLANDTVVDDATWWRLINSGLR
ncbi:GH25 family lysozyme [Nannocystis pusilla]|uniref:GH25 family lysozyme n=1 Tax=Nannocystis pusilla TaxID=889268 RepID=UPI003DA35502